MARMRKDLIARMGQLGSDWLCPGCGDSGRLYRIRGFDYGAYACVDEAQLEAVGCAACLTRFIIESTVVDACWVVVSVRKLRHAATA